MDSLTHLVAGALTPLAFPGAPKRAALLGFGIAVGELPDIDVLFGSSPEALMLLHRGITHALVWQPLLAFTAVLLVYFWTRGVSRRPASFGAGKLFAIALLALYTHLYLDCMTTFGTRILLPFSDTRVGFPAMFIVDLLLTLPALGLALYAWTRDAEYEKSTGTIPFSGAKARRAARIGLAWILLYPLAALGINAAATEALAPSLTGGKPLVLLPEPLAPFFWKAVVDEGDSFRMATLSPVFSEPPQFAAFTKPEPSLYAALTRQQPIFSLFARFSPLMVQSRRPASYGVRARYGENVTQYAFMDIRYIVAGRSPARLFGWTEANFVLEARVNDSKALLAYRFLHRESLTGTPWVELP